MTEISETFLEHTIKRRQRLSSLWYPDEIVYCAIGPKLNNDFSEETKHDYSSHFSQALAIECYRDGFMKAVDIIREELPKLKQPKDFEELYDWVCKLFNGKQNSLSDIKGIGLLSLYDISLAIGCNLYPKVLPGKYVYTHDNLSKAAEVLVGKPDNKNRIEAKLFSACLPHFSAMEIEDILCVYGSKIIKEGKFEKKWLLSMP